MSEYRELIAYGISYSDTDHIYKHLTRYGAEVRLQSDMDSWLRNQLGEPSKSLNALTYPDSTARWFFSPISLYNQGMPNTYPLWFHDEQDLMLFKLAWG